MTTNFPNSIDVYSVKVDNVDNVMASHINNLQDAVVGIESFMGANGSNRVVCGDNSSKSTYISNFNQMLASGHYDGYNTTGAPTANAWYHLIVNNHTGLSNYQLQIACQFDNQSNFFMRTVQAGNYGSWRRIFHAANMGLGCMVSNANAVTVPNASYYVIPHSRYEQAPQIANYGPWWDGSTAIYAREPGYYMAFGQVTFNGNTNGGHRTGALYINGGQSGRESRHVSAGQFGGGWISCVFATLLYLTAGNYVQLAAYQDSGTSLATIGGIWTNFGLYKIWGEQ